LTKEERAERWTEKKVVEARFGAVPFEMTRDEDWFGIVEWSWTT